MAQLTESFRLIATAFNSFIDSELSGKYDVSKMVYDDKEKRDDGGEEERSRRPAIKVHREEKIVFINWMEMFKRMPDVGIKGGLNARTEFENESYSKNVSELIKWLGMLIDDNQNFESMFQTRSMKSERKWEVRFYHFPEKRRVTAIVSDDRDLLVTIKGIPIVRGKQVVSEPEALSWRCAECLQPITQFLKRGEKIKKKFERVCTNFIGDPAKQQMCKSRSWIGGEVCKYKDFFYVQIEATIDDTPNKLEPPVFSLELCDNICSDKFLNELHLGSTFTFTGIIKMKERTDKQGVRFDMPYMEVMSFDEIEKKKFDLNISEKEKNEIREFLKKPDSLDTAKDMFGQRVIGFGRDKKMFLLAKLMQDRFNRLKGANPKNYIIHILIVGNYATGKSELAEVFQEICENPYYIIGSSTSGVGLTGVTIRDELTGMYGIQAGVLARASNSVLIIEEFDKTRDKAEFGVLNESMSSFSYTVTKGGKNRKFKSNTMVVMIANPEKKMFDESLSLIPQINITGDLLSRFSAISCILSRKNIESEIKINNIMIQRSGEEIYKKDQENAEFLKKCLNIASENEPKMNVPEVMDYVNNFTKQSYVLAQQTSGTDKDFYSSITPRHRMALIKMIKGVAMWHLHPVPTKEDMDEAYGIMAEFWKEFVNRPKLLNLREIEQGMSMQQISDKVSQKITDESWDVVKEEKIQTKMGKVELLLEHIEKECEDKDMIPVEEIIEWATQTLGYSNRGVEEVISGLVTKGELFEPKNGFVKTM